MAKHVLYINTPSHVGGAEISLLLLMNNLDKEKYTPYLVTQFKNKLFTQADLDGIPVFSHHFPWLSRRRPWIYGSSIYNLCRIVRKNRINIIHTNCDHSLQFTAKVSKITRIPFVSHIRDLTRSWFSPASIKTLKRASLIIANSNFVRDYCIQQGLDAKKVVAIANPIDIEKFSNLTDDVGIKLRREFQIPEDAVTIGIVGHIQPIKGHAEFFEASMRLAEKYNNIFFVIIGEVLGSENEMFLSKYLSRIEQSCDSDRFKFVGHRDDIQNVMKSIDILAIPSHTEAFGRVAVEGMASGCAIVASNVGGLPEIITHEKNGLLIPPYSVEALYVELERFIVNSCLRKKLIESKEILLEKYSVDNHASKIQLCYDEVLDY